MNLFDYFILDYDECSHNMHRCDQNADCIDTVGSHTCHCRSGYTGNGHVCTGKNYLIQNICAVTDG